MPDDPSATRVGASAWWLVIGGPLVVVVASLVTTAIAVVGAEEVLTRPVDEERRRCVDAAVTAGRKPRGHAQALRRRVAGPHHARQASPTLDERPVGGLQRRGAGDGGLALVDPQACAGSAVSRSTWRHAPCTPLAFFVSLAGGLAGAGLARAGCAAARRDVDASAADLRPR